MNSFTGIIFSGDFDRENNQFYLQQVKNLITGSTLSKEQLNHLTSYLSGQSDTCTITVNDQIPILLQQDEVKLLLNELEIIQQELA